MLNIYQVNQKKIPLRLLLILQQCMGIFVRNFTRLLSDQTYTLSPSFIEIFLELTKPHSFNHDNPHFTVFVSMFIRMSIQCSLKFEITSITKERLLASILTSLLMSVATHLADDFFLKCPFWHRVQHGKDFSGWQDEDADVAWAGPWCESHRQGISGKTVETGHCGENMSAYWRDWISGGATNKSPPTNRLFSEPPTY